MKILPKIDIGAYRQVASKKKKPFHVDSKSARQALDHKQIKSHIEVLMVEYQTLIRIKVGTIEIFQRLMKTINK